MTNTRKCFTTRLAVVLLGMILIAGCGNDQDPGARSAEIASGDDQWPLGDGSAWFNVMETGFNEPELASAAWLAEAGVVDLPAEQEFDTGGSPIIAGLVGKTGFSRLVRLDGSSESGIHVALRDRFWIDEAACIALKPLVKGGDCLPRTHFTGGGSGRGVGHFGNLSHGHYWIYF